MEGSYLVLKWSPTNNNSSFKISTIVYTYNIFRSLELETQLKELLPQQQNGKPKNEGKVIHKYLTHLHANFSTKLTSKVTQCKTIECFR